MLAVPALDTAYRDGPEPEHGTSANWSLQPQRNIGALGITQRCPPPTSSGTGLKAGSRLRGSNPMVLSTPLFSTRASERIPMSAEAAKELRRTRRLIIRGALVVSCGARR